jgi:hypothetical protein
MVVTPDLGGVTCPVEDRGDRLQAKVFLHRWIAHVARSIGLAYVPAICILFPLAHLRRAGLL